MLEARGTARAHGFAEPVGTGDKRKGDTMTNAIDFSDCTATGNIEPLTRWERYLITWYVIGVLARRDLEALDALN